MGSAARQRGSQERHKTQCRIARLMIWGLVRDQFTQRSLTSSFQVRLLRPVYRTGFCRKPEPHLPPALQFRYGDRKTSVRLTSMNPSVEQLLDSCLKASFQFLVATSDPCKVGAHR